MNNKCRISRAFVRNKNKIPNTPPATSALSRSLRLSQRNANRQADRIRKNVGSSARRDLVFETRVWEEISNIVHSRKIANKATITPAERLWSCFPSKYKTTGKNA